MKIHLLFGASRRDLTTHTARTLGLLLCGTLLMGGAQAASTVHVKLNTSAGDITLELYPEQAPKTVENFVQYVKDKHYDGTIFHRVISNFMIQGGGFDASYVQKKTRPPVEHEGREALAKGGLHNSVGTVAMARTNDPQSATAQFFINVKDNAFLDPVVIPPGDPVPKFEYQGRVYENTPRAALLNAPQLFGYTVFGKVIAGMDVVEKIRNTPTGAGGPFPSDVPKTPITILKATLEN
jgi:peptidyl-prolyl cis-trans isomerase A (cyclophilin A)